MISNVITMVVIVVMRVKLVIRNVMITIILHLVATMMEETAMIKTNGPIVQTLI